MPVQSHVNLQHCLVSPGKHSECSHMSWPSRVLSVPGSFSCPCPPQVSPYHRLGAALSSLCRPGVQPPCSSTV